MRINLLLASFCMVMIAMGLVAPAEAMITIIKPRVMLHSQTQTHGGHHRRPKKG